ncbi:MAG TPA: tRNA pseudouridine(38-40) synthase TruA [Saprospiraceae bacterium]|nr:tRNA pseudouridine(38-40) synthase TruA [Saprospiraceae bacterium]
MRYFFRLAFDGSKYKGWQHQKNAKSVQDTLTEAITTYLRTPTEIIGCGRTDTGVHASNYYIHFDSAQALEQQDIMHLNAILPSDIVVYEIISVSEQSHARFDAYERTYHYFIETRKNPFNRPYCFTYFPFNNVDRDLLNAAASLLLEYDDFSTFCKTHSGAKTKLCNITKSEWHFNKEGTSAYYTITANRFLRGMVRLIVGMCMNVGLKKISLEEVKSSLEEHRPLSTPWSVPPAGLFLSDIKYPYVKQSEAIKLH